MLLQVHFKEHSQVLKCLNPWLQSKADRSPDILPCAANVFLRNDQTAGTCLLSFVAYHLSHPFPVGSLASGCRPRGAGLAAPLACLRPCQQKSPRSPCKAGGWNKTVLINSMQLSGEWCRSWIRAPVALCLFSWLSSQVTCVLFCWVRAKIKCHPAALVYF